MSRPSDPPAESLTVAVTCYNHAAFIEKTLESIFSQSRRPDEVVVIDDASTDGSADVVERVAARAPLPVRLLRRKVNSGSPARPTNEAVAAARTSLVALAEGDDPCVPGRLEAQCRALALAPDAILCFGLSETSGPDGTSLPQYRIDRDEVLAVPHRQLAPDIYVLEGAGLYRRLLDHRNLMASFSNMMFRKPAWDRVHGVREKYRVCLDLDFACRSCAAGPIVLVAQVTCIHRLHGANAGSSSGIRNRRELVTLKADHAAAPAVAGAIDDLVRQLPQLLLTEGYWEARDGMIGPSIRTYLRAARAGASPAQCFHGSGQGGSTRCGGALGMA